MSGWRCFVAVPIGDDLRQRLGQAVDEWRVQPEAADLRWTDPGGWHVTLAFMGSTDPLAVSRLTAALSEAVGDVPPFRVRAGGIGTFPRQAAARVLWYGLADSDGRLADLSARVRAAVGVVDDDHEDRFRPHLTLARANNGRGTRLPAEWPDSAAVPSGELTVDRVVLYRSQLGRGPAHYEALASAPLRGASA